jgi:hypothetical protein
VKDTAGLKATIAGCDVIRSADIPPTRAMLDRHTERQFLRILTQNYFDSDLIPDQPDGMVDEQDLPILDSWIERTADELWVTEDKVERSVPVDLEFVPWDENPTTDHHENFTTKYHGTNKSRRVSGWLRSYNKPSKQVGLEPNQGFFGEYETAFDREMVPIADIMDYVDGNHIPDN